MFTKIINFFKRKPKQQKSILPKVNESTRNNYVSNNVNDNYSDFAAQQVLYNTTVSSIPHTYSSIPDTFTESQSSDSTPHSWSSSDSYSSSDNSYSSDSSSSSDSTSSSD